MLTASLGFLSAVSAYGEPVPRTRTISGQVVQTRAGEDIVFVENTSKQALKVRQDVRAGDVIRTNPTGQIALLFADRRKFKL